MKTCPVGTGVLDKLECTKACTQLGLPFVEKKFKAGRKCYKNGKGMCNQNGAAGSKATMLCKVVGKWIKHISFHVMEFFSNIDDYQILIYMYTICTFIEGSNYRTPQNKGACTVQLNGIDMFHEECHCRSSQLAICKITCDSDENCKGYVNSGAGCHMATTSSCPSDCKKYHKENIGELVIDGSLNDLTNSYEGCFIKYLGKAKHV